MTELEQHAARTAHAMTAGCIGDYPVDAMQVLHDQARDVPPGAREAWLAYVAIASMSLTVGLLNGLVGEGFDATAWLAQAAVEREQGNTPPAAG